MSNVATARLDAFTDAAFAFAVSLMVVGAGGTAPDYDALILTMGTIPSFAIGFALIVMFWFGHVRWRRFRGDGDWRSLLLTIALVFAVLVYVHPLRAMAASFAAFLTGRSDSYGGHLAEMFALYGVGFTVMSLITCGLYRDARRNPELSPAARREATGQAWIWAILAATGVASTLLTFVPGVSVWAPTLYATLPVTIPLFAWRWDWSGQDDATA